MAPGAPEILLALEQSALAAAIRQSPWVYPAANILHVTAVVVFAGAVAVMDLALLGAFRGAAPGAIAVPVRQAAMAALGLVAATGFVLFAAEASHVALNPVFQAKFAVIALAGLNALLLGRMAEATLRDWPREQPLPARVVVAAMASLVLWVTVAALGRAIAYW
jgi:hypothetical protein